MVVSFHVVLIELPGAMPLRVFSYSDRCNRLQKKNLIVKFSGSVVAPSGSLPPCTCVTMRMSSGLMKTFTLSLGTDIPSISVRTAAVSSCPMHDSYRVPINISLTCSMSIGFLLIMQESGIV